MTQLQPELVRAFVGAAHADLDQVKALLEQEPDLLHATMNWSGGDWETALGAAAHVGRRDIAEWLIGRGARLDLFAAAMLGELDVVRSALNRYPSLLHAKGPHGIPLLQHALIGGEQAKDVAAYLKSRYPAEEKGSSSMIVVENRIEARAGFAEAVMERFKTPKSVHTFPGFVRMDVLHAKTSEGTEEIRVCTTWEKEEHFQTWSNSDSFRHAHAKRAEAAAAASQGETSAHGQGHGHGHGHGVASPADNPNAPIIGNKVTIYRVFASHLPEPKESAEAAR